MRLSVPVDHEVTLNVRHRPGRDGRPFLLLHGLASNARMWDDVAGRLADAGHPVYAIDMRGHGDSGVPEHGYDNEAVVADLAAVCRELRLTGALLAGHSWGGMIAVRFASVHPDLAAGLALVDGGWINHTDTPDRIPTWQKDVEKIANGVPGTTGATAQIARERIRTLHPHWSEDAVEAMLADLAEGPDGLLVQRLPLKHRLSILYSMWNDSPARWYPGIAVPVLMLIALPSYASSLGDWVRKWVAEAESAIAQVDSRWYVGADHNLHADQPERVTGDLLELARSADRPALERS